MRQGQFEYQVTPLGPTNALATFHSDFNDCLWTCMDDSVAYYLDDILIYSAKGKEHEEHVRHMLCRLKKFVVYCIVKMCQVWVSAVGFPGCVITSEGVCMELDWISTVEDWPTQNSVRDIQVLLWFTNLYQRFSQKYVKVTLPLRELLNISETSCSNKSNANGTREWTWVAELTF